MLVTLLRTTAAVLGAFAATAAPSHAALIDNNTYTTDTATRLDWLDLTATRGLSYDQVLEQTQPGGALDGWRHASRDDVRSFWVNAGGVAPFDGPTSGAENWVGLLHNLWGKTYSWQYSVTDVTGYAYLAQTTIAMIGEPSTTCADCMRTVYLLDNISISDSNFGDQAQLEQLNEAYRWQGQQPIGHALIRPSLAVPEPSSIALLMSGALVFGLWRTGRQAPRRA